MNDLNLVWTYLWNIIFNSFLSLLTLFLLVEFFLWITRIKCERIKTYCRCLPLLKLPFDLLFYDFSSWALAHGLNPWTSAPGTRMLRFMFALPDLTNPFLPLLTRFQFFLQTDTTFTLADLAALNMNSYWLKIIVLSFLCFSIVYMTIKGIAFFHSRQQLKNLLSQAKYAPPIFSNLHLIKALHQFKVKVLISEDNHSPYAASFKENIIVFPKSLLSHLSQEEYEAILAHEIEHFRWRDSLLKMCLKAISVLFWWVPTQWIIRRIELNQEQSCDNATMLYGIDRLQLASAITKVLRLQMPYVDMPATSCIISKAPSVKRLKALLQNPAMISFSKKWVQLAFIAFFMTALLLGKFWIF